MDIENSYLRDYSRSVICKADEQSGCFFPLLFQFKPFQFCVSHSEFFRHGGRVIHGLAPGNYSFRVMASSLAGPGNWTRPVYFVIAERTGEL